MLVRLGTQEDFDSVDILLKEFHAESLTDYNILYNEKIMRLLMDKFLGSSFVLEDNGKIVGVLGGLITVYPLNNEKMYQEFVWFVSKKYRWHGARLYFRMITYCKENGIHKVLMGNLGNNNCERFDKFYEKMGFKLLEKHYLKDLGGIQKGD